MADPISRTDSLSVPGLGPGGFSPYPPSSALTSARTSRTQISPDPDPSEIVLGEGMGGSSLHLNDENPEVQEGTNPNTSEPAVNSEPITATSYPTITIQPQIQLPEPSSAPLPNPSPQPQQNTQQQPSPTTDSEPLPQTPLTSLTLLHLTSRRRTMSFPPPTPISRVKELIWSAWPSSSDWPDTPRPHAPGSLRLLWMGKMLQDEDTLEGLGFPASFGGGGGGPPVSTIVHCSVRPPPPPGNEESGFRKRRFLGLSDGHAGSGGGAGGEGEHGEEAGCCSGCVIS